MQTPIHPEGLPKIQGADLDGAPILIKKPLFECFDPLVKVGIAALDLGNPAQAYALFVGLFCAPGLAVIAGQRHPGIGIPIEPQPVVSYVSLKYLAGQLQQPVADRQAAQVHAYPVVGVGAVRQPVLQQVQLLTGKLEGHLSGVRVDFDPVFFSCQAFGRLSDPYEAHRIRLLEYLSPRLPNYSREDRLVAPLDQHAPETVFLQMVHD